MNNIKFAVNSHFSICSLKVNIPPASARFSPGHNVSYCAGPGGGPSVTPVPRPWVTLAHLPKIQVFHSLFWYLTAPKNPSMPTLAFLMAILANDT